MLNQIVVCGRISSISAKKLDGKEVQEIIIAAPRSYKNADGVYDTDFIPFILTGNIASNTLEYCRKGDIVGIKGSIRSLESKDGKHPFYLSAEKISFLSSKAPSTDEEEE
jgi:single-strand DNA-binding protein